MVGVIISFLIFFCTLEIFHNETKVDVILSKIALWNIT